jgi:hypothetical protein
VDSLGFFWCFLRALAPGEKLYQVIAYLAKATKRDHSGDPPLVFLYTCATPPSTNNSVPVT